MCLTRITDDVAWHQDPTQQSSLLPSSLQGDAVDGNRSQLKECGNAEAASPLFFFLSLQHVLGILPCPFQKTMMMKRNKSGKGEKSQSERDLAGQFPSLYRRENGSRSSTFAPYAISKRKRRALSLFPVTDQIAKSENGTHARIRRS